MTPQAVMHFFKADFVRYYIGGTALVIEHRLVLPVYPIYTVSAFAFFIIHIHIITPKTQVSTELIAYNRLCLLLWKVSSVFSKGAELQLQELL